MTEDEHSDRAGYKTLLDEMPRIADAVSKVPAAAQARAFDTLVAALGLTPSASTSEEKGDKSSTLSDTGSGSNLDGIATVSDDGTFHLTVRDLKAKNARDAMKRLAYVLIRAHMILTGGPASRKVVITPWLQKWRLYDGNSRGFLASDKGIIRSGDEYSLDVPGAKEADGFIADIKDTGQVGSWVPTSVKKSRKKKKSVEEK